jgi:chemotaxis protein MotB
MVQGYFQNPVGFRRSFSGGRTIVSQGNSLTDFQLQDMIILRRREEEERLREAAATLQAQLDEMGIREALDAIVEVIVTDQGLRIEMMEANAGETFFERASATPKPALRSVLALIATQIGALPNGVVIEGHTDAMPFGRDGYTNWELSVDRANSARRVLVETGMPPEHLVEVRGYADQQLKVVENPYDPRNRRISLLLPFDTPDPARMQLPEAEEGIDPTGVVGMIPTVSQ